MSTLDIIIGLLAGTFLGYLIHALKAGKAEAGVSQEAFDALQAERDQIQKEQLVLDSRYQELRKQADQAAADLKEKEEAGRKQLEDLSTTRERLKNLEEDLQNQKADTEKMLEQNFEKFDNLARKILEENSQKFTQTNKEKLDELLKPFQTRIIEFREEVQKNHKAQDERFLTFTENLKQLKELNRQISDDATALTKALKGETKRQGNWGEMILQTILKKSGLTEGEEYEVEQSFQAEVDGEQKRVRPDVIVNLPDERHVVIDSKVSLTAFEQYANAEDDEAAEQALKEHTLSLSNHIKGITVKNYQQAHGLNSLDFILVFIPIEAAFNLALQRDTGLYDTAFEKNIVIVTPSTLLATLRVVENLWRQEKQNRNALEIANQAGKLYDKFAGFLEDMEKLKDRLRQAQESFDAAENKLQSGRGNLISRTEKLKALGARTTKQLPAPQEDFEEEDPS